MAHARCDEGLCWALDDGALDAIAAHAFVGAVMPDKAGQEGAAPATGREAATNAAITEGTNLLFGLALFAAGSALAIVIVAMYQDTALMQQASVHQVSFTPKDRLVTPGIVRTAAGFLFTTTAALLVVVFKEVFKPDGGGKHNGWRWVAVVVFTLVAVAGALLIGTDYFTTRTAG